MDAQDDIARVVLRLIGADDELPLPLSSEEQAAVDASKAGAAHGVCDRANYSGSRVDCQVTICQRPPLLA